jgi:hypothetical protein
MGNGDGEHDPDPTKKPPEDPTVSPDPFEPTGTTQPIQPPSTTGALDPSAAPVVDDPVAAVLGGAAKASGTPDSFRAIPESVKAILDEPTPPPDVTGLDPKKAATAQAQWVTREKLRAAGLGLDSLAPVDPKINTPGVLSADERADASAQASSSSLGDYWRFGVENTAYLRETQGAEPAELTAIEGVTSLCDDLDAWMSLRTGSATPDALATGADDIRKKVVALDATFSDPKSKQGWMDGPIAILKGVSRELARQMAENLQGRSFTVASTADGVAYTLRQATSRYQGAFTAASDVQKAAATITQGAFASTPWARGVGNGATAVTGALKDIANAHKDPRDQPAGTPPLGVAINNFVAGADALSSALAAGRGYLEQKSPTGPRPIEYDQLASLGVYLATACQSVVGAEPLARGKFDSILLRIRRNVAPETPVAGDLTGHWSQARQVLTDALKASDRDAYDSLTSKLGALPLDGALTAWSTAAQGMPRAAAKLYASSWNIATLIGQTRVAVRADAPANMRVDALRALDDIAITVSTQMIQYSALFPAYF